MTSHLEGLLFAIQAMSLLDAEPVFFRTQASSDRGKLEHDLEKWRL